MSPRPLALPLQKTLLRSVRRSPSLPHRQGHPSLNGRPLKAGCFRTARARLDRPHERTARIRLLFPIPARSLSLSSRPCVRSGPALPGLHDYLSVRRLPQAQRIPSPFPFSGDTADTPHPAIFKNALLPRRRTHPCSFPAARMSLPARRRGTAIRPKQGLFGAGTWGRDSFCSKNAPAPTTNLLPIPGAAMLSCGRSKLCETRFSARCARLVCW